MDLDPESSDLSHWFHEKIIMRRSIRNFTDHKFSDEIIINAVKAAASAPSGANRQPWHFSIVSSATVKREIRCAAETVEQQFYSNAQNKTWVKDLSFLKIPVEKPFLEKNSHLIIISIKTKLAPLEENYCTQRTYYAKESTSIAVGFLLASLHLAGVSTLTHTPRPPEFLEKILKLKPHTKPFMIIVAGQADRQFKPPELKKRPFDEIASVFS